MSDETLEPLAPEFNRWLDAERQAPEMPGEVAKRLFQRISNTISDLDGGPEGDPDGGSGQGPADGGGEALGQAGTAGAGQGLGAGSALSGLAAKPLAIAATSFVLGAGTGAGAMALLNEPAGQSQRQSSDVVATSAATTDQEEITPSIPSPAPADAGGSAAEVAVAADAALAPPKERSTPAPSQKRSSKRMSSDEALADERAMLEIARTALTRSDASTALASLKRHARRHPRGRMAEERDALIIQSMVQLGNVEKARAHAKRFIAIYPKSLFRAIADRALRSK